jgi:hypothetical protein
MFNFKNVRENVHARLRIISGNVTEDRIHDLYDAAIKEELKRTRENTVALILVATRATKQEKDGTLAWAMFDKSALAVLTSKLQKFVDEIGA